MSAHDKSFREGNMDFHNGILHIKYNRNIVVDENLLYKQFLFRKKMTQEQDLFIMVNLCGDINVADEAIDFIASHPCPDHIKAIALVAKSDIDYVSGKLYSVFDKPNIMTKVFLSEEEARLWLKSLERNNFIGKAC